MTSPPGWYPDPSWPARPRWWDGTSWNERPPTDAADTAVVVSLITLSIVAAVIAHVY